jgi:hypothetical protein
MQQTPFGHSPLAKQKLTSGKERIGLRKSICGQSRRESEEEIHGLQNQVGSDALESKICSLKIGNQPSSPLPRRGGQFFNYLLKLFRAETIQEEMRHNEIKFLFWWRPFKKVGLKEFYSLKLQSVPFQAPFRQCEHPLAGVGAHNSGLFPNASAFDQEPSVALAAN